MGGSYTRVTGIEPVCAHKFDAQLIAISSVLTLQ